MKKLLLSGLLLSAITVNAQVVKKVVLYDYTGVGCQFCTDGTTIIEGLLTANPTNFLPVQIHTSTSYTPANSKLRTPEGDIYNTFAKPSGYPSGSVDFIKYNTEPNVAMSRSLWSPAFNVRKALTADMSLAIDDRIIDGSGNYTGTVNVKFANAPTAGVKYNVNIFVLQDSLKADPPYQQSNFSGGPHGGASPLTYATHKYVHNNILRKVLTGAWGDTAVIKGDLNTDSVYTKSFSITLDPDWGDPKNLRVLAFVTNSATKEILNGEQISFTAFGKVSVEQVSNKLEILSAYPNPAKIGDVVNVAFDIANNELVTMNVYNAVGQHVSTPYISKDVKGSHTIQWKTGLDNLTPGLYIIEVATASGKQTQRITLQ